jgi:hypothetical protein
MYIAATQLAATEHTDSNDISSNEAKAGKFSNEKPLFYRLRHCLSETLLV